MTRQPRFDYQTVNTTRTREDADAIADRLRTATGMKVRIDWHAGWYLVQVGTPRG